MVDYCSVLHKSSPKKSTDFEDVNKVLTVVVKRRKAIPTQCMEISGQSFALELQRLENAKIVTEENSEKEKFNKIIQSFKKLKSFQMSLEDLHEAEMKLENGYRRTKEINAYLQNIKNY